MTMTVNCNDIDAVNFPYVGFLTDLFPDMADESVLETSDEPKKNNRRNQNKNYAVKKRLPLKPVEGDNVIFVTKKTNFKVRVLIT